MRLNSQPLQMQSVCIVNNSDPEAVFEMGNKVHLKGHRFTENGTSANKLAIRCKARFTP